MKFWIFVLAVFLVSFVSAENITLEYDENIEQGEEFLIGVELIDFPDELYDIKFDMVDSGENIGRVLVSNEWKSSYYYVNDAISSSASENFKLKIEEYIGELSFAIKIRGSTGSPLSFSGYEIKVSESQESPVSEQNNNNNDANQEVKEDEPESNQSSKKIVATANVVSENQADEIIEEIEREPIILSPQDIKSEKSFWNSGSVFSIAGLGVFSIVIGILLFIKFKPRKNELV